MKKNKIWLAVILIVIVCFFIFTLQNKIYKTEINELNNKIDDLESQLEDTQIRVDDIESKIEEFEDQQSDLESRIKYLEY